MSCTSLEEKLSSEESDTSSWAWGGTGARKRVLHALEHSAGRYRQGRGRYVTRLQWDPEPAESRALPEGGFVLCLAG